MLQIWQSSLLVCDVDFSFNVLVWYIIIIKIFFYQYWLILIQKKNPSCDWDLHKLLLNVFVCTCIYIEFIWKNFFFVLHVLEQAYYVLIHNGLFCAIKYMYIIWFFFSSKTFLFLIIKNETYCFECIHMFYFVIMCVI